MTQEEFKEAREAAERENAAGEQMDQKAAGAMFEEINERMRKSLKEKGVIGTMENTGGMYLPAEFVEGGQKTEMSLVAQTVRQMMEPILESIGQLLKNNTEAIAQIAMSQEQIAMSQDLIRNRMEALEKQMRLSTPVTDRQAKYLADAARGKAKELLDKKNVAEDRKAVTKLAGIIRKQVMMRYGVGSLREIPKVEYNVAMNMIETWNGVLDVMEIAKEARKRMETEEA